MTETSANKNKLTIMNLMYKYTIVYKIYFLSLINPTFPYN